jgi:acetyl esterase/lipase
MTRRIAGLIACVACVATTAFAQAPGKTETNVVYGMHSGLALLMDVYHPTQSNGRAIVAIQGSGWNMPLGYDAVPLKDRPAVTSWRKLTDAGYTLFVINHRATPAFRYPDPVEDAQRAVRFVRANAKRFGVSGDEIGAIGASSGGHLVGMLGTLDGKGDPADSDPVNRFSAKVQTVVAIYGAFDLKAIQTEIGGPAVALLVGSRPPRGSGPGNTTELRRFSDASPVTYVTADDASFLLFHGDADQTVPFEQSRIMENALKKAGVPVTFIPVPGGGHGADFLLKPGDPRLPDVIGHATKWFDTYLKGTQRSSR